MTNIYYYDIIKNQCQNSSLKPKVRKEIEMKDDCICKACKKNDSHEVNKKGGLELFIFAVFAMCFFFFAAMILDQMT